MQQKSWMLKVVIRVYKKPHKNLDIRVILIAVYRVMDVDETNS